MTAQSNANRGCFKSLKLFWSIVFFFTLLCLTGVNLLFSNMFGETCGYIHPLIFEAEVSIIEDTGAMIVAPISRFPAENDERLLLLAEASTVTDETEDIILDTVLRVYDSDGVLLDFNDDFEDLSSELPTFGLPTAQEIIIEVGTYADSSEGVFTLEVFPNVDAEEYLWFEFEALPYDGEVLLADTTLSGVGDSVSNTIFPNQRIRYPMWVEAEQVYTIRLNGTQGISQEDSRTSDVSVQSERRTSFFLDSSSNVANRWSSCLQYYGFVSDTGYNINDNGLTWFISGTEAEDKLLEVCTSNISAETIREFLAECVQSSISVSTTGRLIFFVLLAILVVSLPIFILDVLEGQREIIWYLFLFLVVVYATTTAMLFLHLGDISGIEALSEFGFGIFGGITTGAALVFIDKLANRAEDGTSMIIPPNRRN